MSTDALSIARDLLRCPSVTPVEGGALSFLETTLKGAGFTVHRMTFSEPGTYVLRCRADDGALVADEEITIIVTR